MSTEAIPAIDSVQPYGGGNDVLWHLHKLDIIDKHRLLLTVGSAIHSFDVWSLMRQQLPEDTRSWAAGLPEAEAKKLSVLLRPKDNCYPLEVGTPVFEMPGTKGLEIDMYFDVVLYEKDVIEGKSLRETLKTMIAVVEKVITDLTPFV
jgi:hypothetical protein